MSLRVSAGECLGRRPGKKMEDLLLFWRLRLLGLLPVDGERLRLQNLFGGGPAETYQPRKAKHRVHVRGKPIFRDRVGGVAAAILRAEGDVILAEAPCTDRVIPRYFSANTGRADDRIRRVSLLGDDDLHVGEYGLQSRLVGLRLADGIHVDLGNVYTSLDRRPDQFSGRYHGDLVQGDLGATIHTVGDHIRRDRLDRPTHAVLVLAYVVEYLIPLLLRQALGIGAAELHEQLFA